MRKDRPSYLPVEITYSVLKPFLAGADQGSLELPPYFETDPRNGVSSRSIAVHVQTRLPSWHGRLSPQPFEDIELSLHGMIKSQVGNKMARRKILHSVERRRWSDFNKHHRGKNMPSYQLGDEYYCDLNFEINQPYDSQNSTVAQFLPSMSINGTKYVTQSTALHDRHLVSGSCDVIYWIEARFVPYTTHQSIVNESVRVMSSEALGLKSKPNRVRLVPPRKLLKGESGRFEVEAKTSNSLRMRRHCQSLFSSASQQSQAQPRYMFSIQDSLSRNHPLLTTSGSISTIVLPLTMTVFIPPTTTSSSSGTTCDTFRRRLIGSGFPNTIMVTSTWNTKYEITTSPTCSTVDEDGMEKHTMRREDRVLKFPPFYQSTGSQYTATTDLEITVPKGLPVTSRTSLLAIQHFLSIGIRIGEEEKSASHSTSIMPVSHAAGMTADMRVECIIET